MSDSEERRWIPNAVMQCNCDECYVNVMDVERVPYETSCGECHSVGWIRELPDGFILIEEEWDDS